MNLSVKRVRACKVETIFLVISLCFGSFFALANPPFQAADETRHACRAFQTAEWNPANAKIPKSIVDLMERYGFLIFHFENKVFVKDIKDGFEIPLNPAQRVSPKSIGVTSLPYLPQALGIRLGRLFGLPPLALFYLGRITNLLVWIGLIYLAIHQVPFFKWVFFFISLSPMSLYQASSLSHDASTIGASFALIAACISYAYGPKERISSVDLTWLALLSVFVSLVKALYFPLVFLYFLIPVRKLESRTRYFLAFALILCLSLGIDLFFNIQTGTIPHILAKPSSAANSKPIHGEFLFILEHPLKYSLLLLNTFRINIGFYFESFIGKLGWLDTSLPRGMLLFFGIALPLVATWDGKSGIFFKRWHKALSLSIFCAVTFLIFAFLFLTWSPIESNQIEGAQGRYFIPVAPLLLLLLYDNGDPGRHARYLPYLVPAATVMVLATTSLALVARYFYF